MDLAIEVRGCRLESDATKRRYWLVDHSQPMQARLNCDGVDVRPQLIVKITAKLTPAQSTRVRRQLAIDSVLRGHFHLW